MGTGGGHDRSGQSPIGARVVQGGPQPGIQRLRGRGRVCELIGERKQRLELPAQQSLDQRFPGRKVPVQRAHSDPRLSCDVLQRGLRAGLLERLPCRLKQPLAIAGSVGAHGSRRSWLGRETSRHGKTFTVVLTSGGCLRMVRPP